MSEDSKQGTNSRLSRGRVAAMLLVVALLVGCASTPPPLGDLEHAEQAVATARQAKAEQFAPVDWRLASQTLSQGQAKMGAKDYREATRLLRRARVHADLARLRAENAQARAQIDEQVRENDRLRRKLLGENQ